MRPGCSARQGRQTRADDSSDRRFQRSGAASAGFGSCRLPERRAAAHEGAHFGSCHTFALPRLRAGTASKWPLGNAFVPRSGCGRPRHHATAAAKFLHSPGSSYRTSIAPVPWDLAARRAARLGVDSVRPSHPSRRSIGTHATLRLSAWSAILTKSASRRGQSVWNIQTPPLPSICAPLQGQPRWCQRPPRLVRNDLRRHPLLRGSSRLRPKKMNGFCRVARDHMLGDIFLPRELVAARPGATFRPEAPHGSRRTASGNGQVQGLGAWHVHCGMVPV